MSSYREALNQGRRILLDAGIADGDTDAWLLMENIFQISRSRFFLIEKEEADGETTDRYLEAVKRRAKHIPLQQLTGEAWFYGLRFFINEHVLIPRQDTEILVEEVLKAAKKLDQKEIRILDMCTGSGCILLALLSNLHNARGTGADVSSPALKMAEKNGRELHINAVWRETDLFSKICEKYDIIVSNPPYIASHVIEGLMEEVRDHEPRIALDGKEDGLYFYRRISREAGDYLNEGGILAVEIGYDQGADVSRMFGENGFGEIRIIKDLAGLDRVVTGKKIQEESHV